MALCEFAVQKLLPENNYQPSITPYAAIWHSAVDRPGRTSLFGFFSRSDVGLESHFHILNDGTIEQYMDTTRRADANYRANGFWRSGKYVGAISVETEDDGDPDNRPWTPEQLASSIRLGKWIRAHHPEIPASLCPEWDVNGFGYHTLFPTMWTNARGKTCPGRVRIPQFRDIILPGIAGIEALNQPLIDEEGDEVGRLVTLLDSNGKAHIYQLYGSGIAKHLGGAGLALAQYLGVPFATETALDGPWQQGMAILDGPCKNV